MAYLASEPCISMKQFVRIYIYISIHSVVLTNSKWIPKPFSAIQLIVFIIHFKGTVLTNKNAHLKKKRTAQIQTWESIFVVQKP